MSANPATNGGSLLVPLRLPDFRDYAVDVPLPGASVSEATRVLGTWLRDVIRDNPHNFRIFGPDETASNRLQSVYERSEEHTSELQSRGHLVCGPLPEKKNKKTP